MVWTNLPLGGQEIPVFAGSQDLGEVDGQNLLRLQVGSVFALGARRYRVVRLRADRIDVAETTDRATLRLAFGGRGADLDPTLLEAERTLLGPGGGTEILPQVAAARLAAALSDLHREQRRDTLLYCRVGERVWHLTFAGRTLNSLIALWLPADTATAGEISLVTDGLLDLSTLPPTVNDFGRLLRHVDQETGRRSIFQEMLPAELLVRERLDFYQRRPVFGRTLQRLRTARLLEIPTPAGLDLDGG